MFRRSKLVAPAVTLLAVLAGPAAALAHARRNDLRVDVWTVDDADEMKVLAGAGVDAIITNVPDIALDALA